MQIFKINFIFSGENMEKQKDQKDFEREQARLLANLTMQMERFCQIKEHFFASKFNLTPVEFRCLRFINDNIIITTKELSKQMQLTPGRITHLLNSLEDKHLIKRKMDERDRRSTQVSLTREAEKFIDEVVNEYIILHEEILKYMPKSKRITIMNNMKYFFMAFKDWATEFNEEKKAK